MPRPRRLTLLALLVFAGSLVAGCQQQPGTAAYVGGLRLSDADVEHVVTTIEADLKKIGQPLPAQAHGDVRRLVVQLTVFTELGRRYAVEKGYQLPTVDYEKVGAQIGLPANDPYVHLAGDADAYRQLLLSKAAPGTPTEADLRDGYRRIEVASGGQTAPYEQIKPLLQQSPEFLAGVGVRHELESAASRYGIGVSPRYVPVEMPLTIMPNGDSQLTLVALPLGPAATDAVRDAS
jgi:hypothetical protein